MSSTAAQAATWYQRTFPGRADQVSQVRREIAAHLDGCPAAADAVLIASEFATNAILHSRSRGGRFTIRVRLHRDHVRLECQDAGGVWRGRRQADDRPHGLTVVAALTGPGGWGADRLPDGTRVVWATLECTERTEM